MPFKPLFGLENLQVVKLTNTPKKSTNFSFWMKKQQYVAAINSKQS